MASPTRWAWVWVNSGSWWWTGRPGVLRFMDSQSRTRLSGWTELNWMGNQFEKIWFLRGSLLGNKSPPPPSAVGLFPFYAPIGHCVYIHRGTVPASALFPNHISLSFRYSWGKCLGREGLRRPPSGHPVSTRAGWRQHRRNDCQPLRPPGGWRAPEVPPCSREDMEGGRWNWVLCGWPCGQWLSLYCVSESPWRAC